MRAQPESLPLPPSDPRVRWLSDRCCLQQDGELRLLVIGGAPLLRFAIGDGLQERLAASLVAESGAAPVGMVQEVFGLDDATLWRTRQRLREGGVEALLPAKRGPRGPWKARPVLVRRIVALRGEGLSARRIAERVGLSRSRVQQIVAGAGGMAEEVPVPALPLEVERSAASPVGAEAGDERGSPEPTRSASPTASGARVEAGDEAREAPRAPTPEVAAAYALLGLSQDGEAEVVFESRPSLPCAGALLAVPALAATGLIQAAREVYGRLHQAVYGLRATMMVLFLLAVLRRPRPEALKGEDPQALGDVLGLLRAPEVKTLRRKLLEIARLGRAHALLRALGQRWLRERDEVLGVLYVDGHVRVYHGGRKLPKAHVAQRNLCVPATTDFWVNEVSGDPVFVVTGKANPALTQVLPGLLGEMEELGEGRKGTVVFDRGGWSPKLFGRLREAGWHLLTYRKGKRRKHPRAGFAEQVMTIDGRKVRYTLSERVVRLSSGLRLREIAELREDGGQTIFVTSQFEPPAVLLAYRMFGRWRQENFFRYMKENFALDALVDHGIEPDDPVREVPNPARKQLDRKLQAARAERAEWERAYGAAAAGNAEKKRPTMRGFKIAHGKIGQALRVARERVAKLTAARRTLPQRVPLGAVRKADRVVRLAPERKLFTDAIKAATYRAESLLLRLLRPHLQRAEDEGRAFLRAAVQLPGDLLVAGDEVTVRLHAMSAPRFTAALRALCEELNALEPRFPETRYRLRYEVAASPEAS